MKRVAATLTALLIVLTMLPAAPAHAEPNLGKMDLGKYVTGPDISLRDLRGRVVVVEYWGITCGPCLRAIPHTTELAEKYGHDKLVIVANQVWGGSERQCKEVWEKHAKSKHVAVRNGGKLPGFDPSGVPSAVIFDHNAKKVWEGHPGSMDRALAEAIANLPEKQDKPETGDDETDEKQAQRPEPIVTGLEPAYFEREIEQINEQDRSIASTLAKLRRAAEKSSRQEQVDEAKTILAAVTGWAQDRQTQAEQARASDPAKAYAIAEHAEKWLGRDELAKPFAEMVKAMEADDTLMDTVRATLLLREVVALAETIGLTEDASAALDRSNSAEVRVITRDLQRIIKTWPNTDAGKKAAKLLTDWKLDG